MSFPLPSVRIYKVKKWKKLSIMLTIVGCVAIIGFAIIVAAKANASNPIWLYLIGISVVGLLAFTAIYSLKTMTSELIIHSNKVELKTLLSTRSVPFSSIEGYRIFDSGDSDDIGDTICIEPIDKNQLIPPVALTDKEILIRWLKDNFTDLTATEYAKVEKELLSDQTLGENINIREENLQLGKKVAVWLTAFAILCPLALQFTNPYNSMAFISISIVPITFICVLRFKGIIHYSYRPNGVRPTAFFALFISTILLCMYGIFNYNYLEHTQLWIPVFVVALILWVLLLATTNEFSKRTSSDIITAIAFLVLMVLYSWGTYRITNCIFDSEPGQNYVSEVVSKRVSEGDGSDTYYVTIKPVGPLNDYEISVEEEVYFRTEEGAPVSVIIKKGRWGTPWYYLDTKE
ncbi:MAG: hypothetical protein HOP37_11945 [Cyclobacteriaceae bacterium]|nr:hypothetical protein [Cyclobacteriaceae bacterium]